MFIAANPLQWSTFVSARLPKTCIICQLCIIAKVVNNRGSFGFSCSVIVTVAVVFSTLTTKCPTRLAFVAFNVQTPKYAHPIRQINAQCLGPSLRGCLSHSAPVLTSPDRQQSRPDQHPSCLLLAFPAWDSQATTPQGPSSAKSVRLAIRLRECKAGRSQFPFVALSVFLSPSSHHTTTPLLPCPGYLPGASRNRIKVDS
ncbi:hypothetical protein BO86DRAFT_32860 [Aspergillus japonicus CBS 114.51]|uniref:Uncharacterized protein n=1 Tax=Aspergillus japonicus CBS 114.51 TaxID=1448312 RepID=A0A8T8X763_ASPJA|nr:hypothetical protein BO86DRAFT_32860 [Aspergillus japonicus CBS 114.51]RAH83724.1 hypothetical protein BO86DRAFT_32860 [Aspergillus japonicus CBS 114.51]